MITIKKGLTEAELYQQLLPCMKGSWPSLAVVPATPALSASVVAHAIVELTQLVRGTKAKLFSTEGLEVPAVSKVIIDVSQHVKAGGAAVVAIDSVVSRQAGVPMALAVDAALLVVHLGVTRMEDAQTTVDIIGRSRFIGAVTLESGVLLSA